MLCVSHPHPQAAHASNSLSVPHIQAQCSLLVFSEPAQVSGTSQLSPGMYQEADSRLLCSKYKPSPYGSTACVSRASDI